MASLRRTALVAGVLYLLTFVGSIPGAMLLEPVLTDPNYVAGPGADTQIRIGAVFELLNALAAIGTALAVFSVVRREHEGLAIGFVATRLFEAAVIAIGIVSVLSVVTLREAGAAGGESAALVPVGQALVAVRDWAMVIGPGMAAMNALMFGTLLFRSRLIPRAIPALGLIGAPLLLTFVVGAMLGVTGVGTTFHAIAVFPFFFWELGAGLWMTFRGFDPNARIARELAAEADRRSAPPLAPTTPAVPAPKAGPA